MKELKKELNRVYKILQRKSIWWPDELMYAAHYRAVKQEIREQQGSKPQEGLKG